MSDELRGMALKALLATQATSEVNKRNAGRMATVREITDALHALPGMTRPHRDTVRTWVKHAQSLGWIDSGAGNGRLYATGAGNRKVTDHLRRPDAKGGAGDD